MLTRASASAAGGISHGSSGRSTAPISSPHCSTTHVIPHKYVSTQTSPQLVEVSRYGHYDVVASEPSSMVIVSKTGPAITSA
jgi:hypothetical protein